MSTRIFFDEDGELLSSARGIISDRQDVLMGLPVTLPRGSNPLVAPRSSEAPFVDIPDDEQVLEALAKPGDVRVRVEKGQVIVEEKRTGGWRKLKTLPKERGTIMETG